MLKITQTKKAPSAEKVIKQLRFGIKNGLNNLGNEAIDAVQGALRGNFILRNQVFFNSPLKVKKIPATVETLKTTVGSAADFLALHDEGGTKKPRGKHLAVPTTNIRPNIRQIIPTSKRPRVLLGGKGTTVTAMRRGKARGYAGKGAFIMRTKNGNEVIAQRIGRGKKTSLKFLYNLEERVRIKRRPIFRDPIEKVVRRRGMAIINKSVEDAMRNIKA